MDRSKTPEELLQELEGFNIATQELRNTFNQLKKHLINVESELIEVALKRERLVEQLRVLRNSTVSVEITERQNEIEKFRRVLPELMEKIK